MNNIFTFLMLMIALAVPSAFAKQPNPVYNSNPAVENTQVSKADPNLQGSICSMLWFCEPPKKVSV